MNEGMEGGITNASVAYHFLSLLFLYLLLEEKTERRCVWIRLIFQQLFAALGQQWPNTTSQLKGQLPQYTVNGKPNLKMAEKPIPSHMYCLYIIILLVHGRDLQPRFSAVALTAIALGLSILLIAVIFIHTLLESLNAAVSSVCSALDLFFFSLCLSPSLPSSSLPSINQNNVSPSLHPPPTSL